jgi:hypothetical protein
MSVTTTVNEVDFQELHAPPSEHDFTFVASPAVELDVLPEFDLLEEEEESEVQPELHGRKPTGRTVIQKEQPWHRTAAYLFSQNMTQKQVALACGKTPAAVNLLFSQTWFQKTVVALIHSERVEDNAFHLLRNAAPSAALTVINLAQNSDGKTSATLQLKASETILTRVLGPVGKEKPSGSDTPEDTYALDELEEQIKNIKAQLTIL